MLVPFSDVDGHAALPSNLRDHVLALIDAYKVERGGRLGAVAYPSADEIGATIDRHPMRLLGMAVLAGVLNGNPNMVRGPEEHDDNFGWQLCTSENALLFGHPLVGSPDSYAVEIGVLCRMQDMRVTWDGEPLPKIDPPVELPTPMMARFDEEIASAAYTALDQATEAARRLAAGLG